jgi:hypothetical protein
LLDGLVKLALSRQVPAIAGPDAWIEWGELDSELEMLHPRRGVARHVERHAEGRVGRGVVWIEQQGSAERLRRLLVPVQPDERQAQVGEGSRILRAELAGSLEMGECFLRLAELLVFDRNHNPSKYSIVLVSEGAMFEGGEMVFSDRQTDAFGHAKLGGIGDLISAELQNRTATYNNGIPINIINQKLGYMVRGGDPDAIDSVVPMAFGNLALDLLLKGIHGRLVVLKNGRYDNVPLDVVTCSKKLVKVDQFYNTDRYRPKYESFEMKPLFIMTSEG